MNDALNGTSFNDLEWPLSQISKSRYYSASNNSQMVQDRAIVTMADRAIFNNLEQPQTQISMSGHSLMLNISKMATDTAIVSVEDE